MGGNVDSLNFSLTTEGQYGASVSSLPGDRADSIVDEKCDDMSVQALLQTTI